jgi:hypothetical protein
VIGLPRKGEEDIYTDVRQIVIIMIYNIILGDENVNWRVYREIIKEKLNLDKLTINKLD